MKLVREGSEDEAVNSAGSALNEALYKYNHLPTLLMLSGGSALKLLPHINTGIFTVLNGVTVVDERFSEDPNVNNFAQIAATDFYKKSKNRGAEFIDPRSQAGETVDQSADRFEKMLRAWLERFKNGKVVAVLGMGADGHTAGIMPYPEDPSGFEDLFMYDEHWVVGYNAAGKSDYPLRITITIPFLRDIVDKGIVFVTGDNKKAVLKRVLDKQGSLSETPALVFHEMKDVTIYMDIKL